MCLQSIVKYTRHIGGLNDLGIFLRSIKIREAKVHSESVSYTHLTLPTTPYV